MKKYENDILNKIFENYSKFNSENTLSIDNDDDLILYAKKGSGIHIKPENRGKFTESAKKAGKTVKQHARDVLNNPNATKLQKKRAQFVINSSK